MTTVLLGAKGDDEVTTGIPQVHTKHLVPCLADTAVLQPSSEEATEEGDKDRLSQDGARS